MELSIKVIYFDTLLKIFFISDSPEVDTRSDMLVRVDRVDYVDSDECIGEIVSFNGHDEYFDDFLEAALLVLKKSGASRFTTKLEMNEGLQNSGFVKYEGDDFLSLDL